MRGRLENFVYLYFLAVILIFIQSFFYSFGTYAVIMQPPYIPDGFFARTMFIT